MGDYLGYRAKIGVTTPSTNTVHAPHTDIPQPNFVPVMPKISRKTHSSRMSELTSTVCSVPFTVREIMHTPSLSRHTIPRNRLKDRKVPVNRGIVTASSSPLGGEDQLNFTSLFLCGGTVQVLRERKLSL